jgi:uncharacterized protein YbcI
MRPVAVGGRPVGLRWARGVGLRREGQQTAGEQRAEIATAIVRLHNEYYGKGPTRAKAYATEGVVVVVLEEAFTKAERTLIDRGETEAIQQIRRRFQQSMADEFRSIVEQVTGRVVRAFLSETEVEADVSVEFFLLGEARTDMDGFEPT